MSPLLNWGRIMKIYVCFPSFRIIIIWLAANVFELCLERDGKLQNLRKNRWFRIKSGSGTYGSVYKAFDTKKNKYVAIKKDTEESDNGGISQNVVREISILKLLSHHPNIVQ